MKTAKVSILLGLLNFILFSCAQDQIECIRISGNIETETRTISGFNKVFFKDVGNLHITQGNEYTLTAQGQKVILDALETTIENEELIINLNRCFNGEAYQLDIYITMPEIEEIEMAGVGMVKSETSLQAEQLSLILSGNVPSFNIDCNVDSLNLQLTGSGNFDLSGECQSQNIRLSGTGDINAYGLISQRAYLNHNASGNCFLQVNEYLEVEINGAGNLYYLGQPEIVLSGQGSGTLIDENP